MNEPERPNPAQTRILIAGGGTGGHAIPALCVAAELKERGAVVEFVGSESGIEKALVPTRGLHPPRPAPRRLRRKPHGPGPRRPPLPQGRRDLYTHNTATEAAGRSRGWGIRERAGRGLGPDVGATDVSARAELRPRPPQSPGEPLHDADAGDVSPRPRPASGVPCGSGCRPGLRIFGASRKEALRELGLEPPVVLVFGGSGGALRVNLAAAEAFRGTTPYSVVQISGHRDFARLSGRKPEAPHPRVRGRYRAVPGRR